MKDSAKEAIASFRRWCVGFNARDTEAQLAEMHFPIYDWHGTGFNGGKPLTSSEPPRTRIPDGLQQKDGIIPLPCRFILSRLVSTRSTWRYVSQGSAKMGRSIMGLTPSGFSRSSMAAGACSSVHRF
jgi:hypothetical protein